MLTRCRHSWRMLGFLWQKYFNQFSAKKEKKLQFIILYHKIGHFLMALLLISFIEI